MNERELLQRAWPWLPTRGDNHHEDRELARLHADIRTALEGGSA